jgi:hypothetical protein
MAIAVKKICMALQIERPIKSQGAAVDKKEAKKNMPRL